MEKGLTNNLKNGNLYIHLMSTRVKKQFYILDSSEISPYILLQEKEFDETLVKCTVMDDRKEEKMKKEENGRKVYVVGHKNPDTDSICSAIAYADLKTKLTGIEHTPRRAGQLNEETQYVLERFGVKVPALLSDLRVQIKDVELRHVEGIQGSMSIKTAWAEMKELNIKTLPVTRNGKLEGLIN